VRKSDAIYAAAFNRLTEKAVNVRSEARDAYRSYRSTYDIAAQYQHEVLPLRKIIAEEMQPRFSQMQDNGPVPVANPIRLAVDRNRAMLLLDVGFVQTDLWNGDRPAAVASCA
jgi:hypothetical protein